MPTDQGLGTNDLKGLQNRWKCPVQLDKEPAVAVGKPGPTWHLAAQNNQLMSEGRILCFKPLLDLNGEAKAARKKQSSANIVHRR
jgi:hypothetical protein